VASPSKKSSSVFKAPDKLRICHLADVHLGYRRFTRLSKLGFNQREVDVNAAFHEAAERVIRLKPDLVLIAGDLFHSVRPSNSVLSFCFRVLKYLVAELKAPCVIVAGNHESPRRFDTGSPLKLLSEIDGVYVADQKIERFNFPDLSLSVLCLPHAALSTLDPELAKTDERFKYNVLLSHAQLSQSSWISDFGGANLKLESVNAHEWDYIAMGHVHIYTELGLNTVYPGSLEHTSHNFWSESSHNKGFVEVELPTHKRTFHALTTPREVVVLKPIDADDRTASELDQLLADEIGNVPGGISGKLLRLEVLNVTREVQRQVNFKAIRAWRQEALNLSVEFKSPERAGRGFLASGVRGRLDQELVEYCKNWETQAEKRDAICSVIGHYLEEIAKSDEAIKP